MKNQLIIVMMAMLATCPVIRAGDIETVTQRLVARETAGKLPLENRCRTALTSQRPDGSWPDIDYVTDNRSWWEASRHLTRTYELASAYAAPQHPLSGKPEMAAAMRRAVNFWSSRRPQCSNWWWNEMFVPDKMGKILLLAAPVFPPGPERDAALAVCRQVQFGRTGTNRVHQAGNILLLALLQNDPATVELAVKEISAELRFVPEDTPLDWHFGGLRADGCFQQHGPQLQFGNYGLGYLRSMSGWAALLAGTKWEFAPEKMDVLRTLVFDGSRWVMWKGRYDLAAVGRQMMKNCQADTTVATLAALTDLMAADPARRSDYAAIIAANRAGEVGFTGNRYFWNSDYMVHRRPQFMVSVRMNSTRVRPIEDDTNWDNALGRYFSDGLCLIMRSGDEYQYLTGCWDWTRLPGTTLPATPVYLPEDSRKIGLLVGGRDPRWTLSRAFRQLGESTFTGGVSDGERGAAVHVMNLDQVKARKAYFLDRDAVWLLGSEITSDSPYAVATTINACRRNGEIKTGDGWVWHDGIGYRGAGMVAEAALKTGDWRYIEGGREEYSPETQEMFTLTVTHGIRPQQQSYAALVLPGATPEATATGNFGQILSNTPQIQAVKMADGMIAAIFYEPGTLESFSTDSPGIFLISPDGTIYAADPTGLLKRMTVTYRQQVKTVELPAAPYVGKTLKITP